MTRGAERRAGHERDAGLVDEPFAQLDVGADTPANGSYESGAACLPRSCCGCGCATVTDCPGAGRVDGIRFTISGTNPTGRISLNTMRLPSRFANTASCPSTAERANSFSPFSNFAAAVIATGPRANVTSAASTSASTLPPRMRSRLSRSRNTACLICDRSVIDNYAYLVHRTGRRAEYDALVSHWVRTYDVLIKVPILTAPTCDGRRDLSAAFQAEIDATLEELVSAFGVPLHRLDPADREGWVDQTLRAAGLPEKLPQIDLFSRATP